MLLLAALLAVSAIAVLYDHHGWDFLRSTGLGEAPGAMVRMGSSFAPLVVVSVTVMILVVEGGTMVADTFRRQLQERAREQGRAEGREQGREEGRIQGREEGHEQGRDAERTRWKGWLARRRAAELENRPFDEPPPGGE